MHLLSNSRSRRRREPRISARRGATGMLSAVLLVGLALPWTAAGAESAQDSKDLRAVSYINPDKTENPNPDVARRSGCDRPDQYDPQQVSSQATPGERNVHNDACLLLGFGEDATPFDGRVTFESSGVGLIFACPDPDEQTLTNGPKTAELRDTDGDGRPDMCLQTGYQSKGAEGDLEYHVRLDSLKAGRQVVMFCRDADRNGCEDERIRDEVTVRWARSPNRAVPYVNPDEGTETENPNVRRDSGCARPDQFDVQRVSRQGSTDRNVHVDACLLLGEGGAKSRYDGRATWAVRGIGTISACPDPDIGMVENGPRMSYLHDHDRNGKADHCHVTGFQSTGSEGDTEYHVRVNSARAGSQRVTFCFDPQLNGCGDEEVRDDVYVAWTRA